MIDEVIKMLMSSPGYGFDLSCDKVKAFDRKGCLDSFWEVITSLSGRKFVKDDCGSVKYLTGGPVSPLLIEHALKCKYLAGNVISFVETDSTNDVAWNYCGKPGSLGMVVLAESQRNGRGRFADRKWYDQSGKSVLMSVLLNSKVVAPDVLGIAAAIAIAESVRELCGLAVTIKWPNDVVCGRRKLAGLMVEARTIEGQEWYVLGIGLNCDQSSSDMPEDIAGKATSILIETQSKVDRDWMIINILDKLDTIISENCDRESLSAIWTDLSSTTAGNIVIAENGVNYEGQIVQVEPFKGFTIRLADGSLRFFDARKATVVAF